MTHERVEALLRPKVEFIAVGTSVVLAIGSWWLQAYMLFTPVIGKAAAVFFLMHATWRTHQGVRLGRFQRGLRRLPFYALSSRQIPCSDKALFVGKGFEWTADHTKRLRDTRKRKFLKYLKAVSTDDAARNMGGAPELHGVGLWEGEHDVAVPRAELVGHLWAVGATRNGKTRLEEILVEQDIRVGNTTIVFDPKGDANLLRRVYGAAKRAGKLDRLYIFHLAFPDLSARYNAIGSFTRITQIAQRITAGLPGEGDSAAFKEFAWRVTNIVARVLIDMDERPDLIKIQRYVFDIDSLLIRYLTHWFERRGADNWRSRVKRIEQQLKNPSKLRGTERERSPMVVAMSRVAREVLRSDSHDYKPVIHALLKISEAEKSYFDKITSNLGPLLEKLTTGKTAEILSPDYADPDDPRPILDWGQVIRERGIVYVGLDALTDITVASAVGQAMFEDLTAKAGELYQYGEDYGMPDAQLRRPKLPDRPISIHADELSAIASESVLNILSRAGGAEFELKGYSQSLYDLERGLGNRAAAQVAIDSLNTLIMLRVQSGETARYLTGKLRPVEIEKESEMFGYHDSAQPENAVEFTSAAHHRVDYQEVKPIEPGDVTSLPKGHAFALLEGNRLHKIRIPLPKEEDDTLPETVATMVESMARQNGSTDWWVDDWFERNVREESPRSVHSRSDHIVMEDLADPNLGGTAHSEFELVRESMFDEQVL